MGGGRSRTPGGHQRLRHMAVEGPPAGAADPAVDGLGVEGMGDLVGEVPTLLLLGHDPEAHQLVEDLGQAAEGMAAHGQELGDAHPVTDHGQHLEDGPAGRVELAQAHPDPFGQVLGQDPQLGAGQVGAFVEEGPNQPGGEQRAALGPVHQPGHQGVAGLLHAREILGQLPDLGRRKGPQVPAEQESFLFQAEEHLRGHRLAGELDRPGGQDQQDGRRGEVVDQIAEGLPRGPIGQVDIVEDDGQGRGRSHPAEEVGQGTEQPDAGRLGRRRPHSGGDHRGKQGGQIGGFGGAQAEHLVRFEGAQVPLESLHPEAE